MRQYKQERAYSVILMVCLHCLCGAAVVAGVKTVPALAGFNIISHPVETLRISLVHCLTATMGTYTLIIALSSHAQPVWQSLLYGLLCVPVGAIAAVVVSLAFGAPTSLESASRTWHWACFMSVLVAVPAAIVLGNSWSKWQRIFAFTRPSGALELAICVPAHGAVIGAWVGAWPMPLDWERPWQVWPVTCTCGAAGGYIVGLMASLLLLLADCREVRRAGVHSTSN